MRAKITLGFLLATVLGLGLLSIGCGGGSGDNRVIAQVNDYDITVKEFNRLYRSGMAFASAQDDFNHRRLILDSIVISRMLIQAAYEKGLDKSEELHRAVLSRRDQFLVAAMKSELINKPSQATEAEMRDYYNHLDSQIRVHLILVAHPDTAQMLFDRLKSGENFGKLATEYSLAPNAEKNQGDMGYMTWGILPDEVQDVAFSIDLNKLSPPIESYMGHFIIRITEKSPNPQKRDYEAMKSGIEMSIFSRNAHRREYEFLENLKGKYDIKIDTMTCQYLLRKRQDLYPPMLLDRLPRSDFDQEQLDRNEKELPMATWNGGQLSVSQYLSALQRMPIPARPDLDDYDSLAATVFKLRLDDFMILEAHSRGFDTDVEYTENLRLFREMTMAELMKKDSLPKPPSPDDFELREYYENNVEEFTESAKVQVWEILLSDEMKAQRLKNSIKSLEQFKEEAGRLTERSGKRLVNGELGFIGPGIFENVFEGASATPVGKIGGPVLSRGKYSIFWVEDKITAQVKDYLGVKRFIFEKLSVERQQGALADWVDQRRSQSNIDIDDEALWSTVDMSIYKSADSGEVSG